MHNCTVRAWPWLLLLLTPALAALTPQTQNETKHAVEAVKVCELPFAPQVCFNQMQGLHKFPDPGSKTYAILCQYPELSLRDEHSRQCLVAARSIQQTQPQFGLIFFLTTAVWIHRDYQQAMDSMNVHVRLFEPIPVPHAAHLSHHAKGMPGWAVAYQKLAAWSFLEYQQLLIMDSDSVVLDNIDWVFSLPGSAMGADCSPHFDRPEKYWKPCIHNSGVLLVQPNHTIYRNLAHLVTEGVDNATQEWQYDGGDQDLLHWRMPLPFLSPTLQLYPDICEMLGSDEAIRLFPIRRALIVQYTWRWGIKGYNMEFHGSNRCWNQFVELWRYFETQVKGMSPKQD